MTWALVCILGKWGLLKHSKRQLPEKSSSRKGNDWYYGHPTGWTILFWHNHFSGRKAKCEVIEDWQFEIISMNFYHFCSWRFCVF